MLVNVNIIEDEKVVWMTNELDLIGVETPFETKEDLAKAVYNYILNDIYLE